MKKSTQILSALTVFALLASSALAEKKPTANGAVAKGNSEFALDLFGKLRTQEGNLFFSPYSISTALAMTQGGARGETAAQMKNVLHLPAKPHKAFSQLQQHINGVQGKGKVKLAVANSLFPDLNYKFLPEFVGLATKNYDAAVTPVDYAKNTEAARLRINGWVEDRTNDKIKDLIKPGAIDPTTRMVLVNAIYFKGNWASQFKPDFTRAQDFKVSPKKTVKTPMMYQKTKARLLANNEVQLLELPYTGNDVTMCLLLPRKADGLAALEAKLTAAQLNGWLKQARNTTVQITLPKFKMTSEFSLSNTLKKLGMRDAFDAGKADFSGMDGSRSLYIYDVVHKAFVDVNEEGTEAAAATGVIVALRSAPVYPRFRANHPFLFFIRDKSTGSILFMGRYAAPTN